jgi:ABC-type glucose/galactose transport system permease subunit
MSVIKGETTTTTNYFGEHTNLIIGGVAIPYIAIYALIALAVVIVWWVFFK